MNNLLTSSALTPGAVGYERKDAAGGTDEPPAVTGEVKDLLAQLQKANEQFQEKVTQELAEAKKARGVDPLTTESVKKLNEQIDKISDQVKELRLEGQRPQLTLHDGSKRAISEAEVKHRQALMKYLRKNDTSGFDLDEVKTLSVGSDPDGGYVVDSVLDSEISRIVSEISPMRQLATVTTLSTAPEYRKLVNTGGANAGWAGESGARSQTDTSKLRERKISPHELFALPYITQTLLDDAAIDIAAWLAEETRIQFAEYESDAFINGAGADTPRGIVGGYEPILHDDATFSEAGERPGYVLTGRNGGFANTNPGDGENNLLSLVYAVKKAYRRNGAFLMARPTISEVRKLRDADGRALWQPMTMAGEPDQLVGYRVEEDDEMPTLATDSHSIAFGDFRAAYRIVDKGGTRVLRDPYSAKPFVQFYTTRRVGGAVQMFEAYKLLRFGTA